MKSMAMNEVLRALGSEYRAVPHEDTTLAIMAALEAIPSYIQREIAKALEAEKSKKAE